MTDAAANAPPQIKVVSASYRNYAMGVLLLIYIMNFVDRQVVNILAEPIKRELGLLDWQLGAMSGDSGETASMLPSIRSAAGRWIIW